MIKLKKIPLKSDIIRCISGGGRIKVGALRNGFETFNIKELKKKKKETARGPSSQKKRRLAIGCPAVCYATLLTTLGDFAA